MRLVRRLQIMCDVLRTMLSMPAARMLLRMWRTTACSPGVATWRVLSAMSCQRSGILRKSLHCCVCLRASVATRPPLLPLSAAPYHLACSARTWAFPDTLFERPLGVLEVRRLRILWGGVRTA